MCGQVTLVGVGCSSVASQVSGALAVGLGLELACRAMHYGVLGPLQVAGSAGPIHLARPKERRLLALLVSAVGRVVLIDEIVAELWPDVPPRTAERTVHSHLVRLRRALIGTGDAIRTVPGGYLLDSEPHAVDAERFAHLARQGQRALRAGASPAAAATLAAALALWRGEAYEEFRDRGFGLSEWLRLSGLRLVAVEDRAEALVSAGAHDAALSDLEDLVRRHPLRERLWGQLMIALYQAGRQSDALAAFRRVRSVLAEEVGVDPGPHLRRLHAAILAQDEESLSPGRHRPAEPLPPALTGPHASVAGREADAVWLREMWAAVRASDGGPAFLLGRRGSGRTRLAAGLADEVAAEGGRVWYASARMNPAVVTTALRAGGGILPPTPTTADLAAAVRAAAADRPALFVLDDLEHAEPSEAKVVSALAGAAAGRAILVLACLDPDVAAAALRELVDASGRAGGRARQLAPLDSAARPPV